MPGTTAHSGDLEGQLPLWEDFECGPPDWVPCSLQAAAREHLRELAGTDTGTSSAYDELVPFSWP